MNPLQKKLSYYIILLFILVIHDNRVYSQTVDPSFKNHNIHFYFFDLEVNNLFPNIRGNVEILTEILDPDSDTLLLELVDEATIDSILVNGQINNYVHSSDLIFLPLQNTYPSGTSLNLNIYYHIDEGDFLYNRGIVTRTDTYGNSITWTLSEPYYSKNWFPCKQDLDDKIDSAYLYFTCPDSCMVGSNGLLTDRVELGNGKTRYEWKTRYPMAYYLISFAVADYRDYSFYASLGQNDSTLVQNFIYNRDDYLEDNKEDIDATAELLELFSNLLGTYPFKDEKYGHCLSPIGGGMEHQTMTTLSDFRFALVAHELGHQWFGDYTTCSNWQDIWINEGFASYTELLAYEYLKSNEEYQAWLFDALLLITSEPDGSVYVPESALNDDRRIFNHRLSYEKGAYLIRMIRHEIGDDDLFFQVLRTFLAEHANSFASADDFKATLEEVSQMDFTNFFNQWYYGEGYPILDFRWTQHNDTLQVTVEQESSVPGSGSFFNLLIDLKISFLGGDTLIQIRPLTNQQQIPIILNEKVYKISPDPEKYLISEIRSVTRTFDTDTAIFFGVFPNPAQNLIYVENYTIGLPFTARLYTTKGIFIDEVSSTEAFATFSLNSLATGIYQVVVTRDTIQEVFRVAKF